MLVGFLSKNASKGGRFIVHFHRQFGIRNCVEKFVGNTYVKVIFNFETEVSDGKKGFEN